MKRKVTPTEVAISRAKCLSIVVGSPKLSEGLTNNIDDVMRLNRLCKIMEKK